MLTRKEENPPPLVIAILSCDLCPVFETDNRNKDKGIPSNKIRQGQTKPKIAIANWPRDERTGKRREAKLVSNATKSRTNEGFLPNDRQSRAQSNRGETNKEDSFPSSATASPRIVSTAPKEFGFYDRFSLVWRFEVFLAFLIFFSWFLFTWQPVGLL